MSDLLNDPYFLWSFGFVATVAVLLSALITFFIYKYKADLWPKYEKMKYLTERVEEIKAEFEENREKLADARNTIEEKNAMEEQVQELKENIANLDSQRLEYERVKEELVAVEKDLEEKRKSLNELDREVEVAKGKEEISRHNLEALREQSEQISSQLEALKGTKQGLENEVSQLQSKKAELDQEQQLAQNSLAHLKDQIHQTQSSLEKLEKGIAEKKKELEKEIAEKKRELEKANQDVAGAATLEDNIQKRIQAEEKNLDRLEQLRREHNELSEKHESRLEARRSQLEEQVAAATPAEFKEISHRAKSLWAPEFPKNELLEPARLDEEASLKNLSQHLDGCGLQFHQRTKDAFHTSLKCASISPIVTLAGVSGTGKSQLPRRYAEAMGIHFLNQPVQPSWDSPDDLLGFYNHLEGLFKPTAFSRSLLQFDPFRTRPIWADACGGQDNLKSYNKEHDLSERMMLVLLDEMNLARIEYYFSEFLSRLENRNDALHQLRQLSGSENLMEKIAETTRESSEIQLDLGSNAQSGSNLLPIFVANNVLFCGTMNEDESTMAISDKVVDRSNVMRFGEPGELHMGTPPAAPEGSPKHLPRTIWNEWCEPIPPDVPATEIEKWINRANRSLSRIGKPFGHRVAQAMKLYIELYPDKSRDGAKKAMADQIEQRVLPKFRGVDPQEEGPNVGLINELVPLIQDLGDDELKDAVVKDIEDDHVFTWSGFSRTI